MPSASTSSCLAAGESQCGRSERDGMKDGGPDVLDHPRGNGTSSSARPHPIMWLPWCRWRVKIGSHHNTCPCRHSRSGQSPAEVAGPLQRQHNTEHAPAMRSARADRADESILHDPAPALQPLWTRWSFARCERPPYSRHRLDGSEQRRRGSLLGVDDIARTGGLTSMPPCWSRSPSGAGPGHEHTAHGENEGDDEADESEDRQRTPSARRAVREHEDG